MPCCTARWFMSLLMVSNTRMVIGRCQKPWQCCISRWWGGPLLGGSSSSNGWMRSLQAPHVAPLHQDQYQDQDYPLTVKLDDKETDSKFWETLPGLDEVHLCFNQVQVLEVGRWQHMIIYDNVWWTFTFVWSNHDRLTLTFACASRIFWRSFDFLLWLNRGAM